MLQCAQSPRVPLYEHHQGISTPMHREERDMIRTLILSTIVLTLLGTASVLVAQSGDETAVAQAVEAFRNAMLKADRAQFATLTAEQLSYGHSAGRVEDK